MIVVAKQKVHWGSILVPVALLCSANNRSFNTGFIKYVMLSMTEGACKGKVERVGKSETLISPQFKERRNI